MKKKSIISAEWYLLKHEWTIRDSEWSCGNGSFDIVADDEDGNLVFVNVVAIDEGKDFQKEKVTEKHRAQAERIAIQYLLTHDDISDVPMRFDVVQVKKLDDTRCLIKHHVNAFGVVD